MNTLRKLMQILKLFCFDYNIVTQNSANSFVKETVKKEKDTIERKNCPNVKHLLPYIRILKIKDNFTPVENEIRQNEKFVKAIGKNGVYS